MVGNATRLQRAFRWLAVAVLALTSLQPVLGAFGFFQVADDLDYTAMHEMIAMILVLLVVLRSASPSSRVFSTVPECLVGLVRC